MNKDTTTAELILDLFKGNKRYIAAAKPGGTFEPYEVKDTQTLTPERFVKSHFKDTCLGFYPINPMDDTVMCAAIDCDDHGSNDAAIDEATLVYQYIKDQGFHPLMEISQSGTGAHIWLFFSKPVEACKIRAYFKNVLEALELKGTEIYPRQDSVQHLAERLGNLIRYPLWNKSHFYNPVSKEVLDPNQVLPLVPKVDPSDLPEYEADTSAGYSGFDTEGLPQRVSDIISDDASSLLARRWMCDVSGMADESNSALVMSIATELVGHRVPTPEIKAALQYWCDLNSYSKSERWLDRTVVNAYNFAANRVRYTNRADTVSGFIHREIDAIIQGDEVLIPFGVAEVDQSFGGISLGEYGLITGRSSNGKSALAFEWAEAAGTLGYPSLFVSLEMSRRAATKRYLPRIGITVDDVKYSSNHQIHAAVREYFKDRPALYFSDYEDVDRNKLDSVCDLIKRRVEENGVKLAIVDYQELVKTELRSTFDSQALVSETLSQLARKLDIALLCLVQLNREYERDGGTPQLRHLKYGGEQDADVIVAGRWMWKETPCPENLQRYTLHCLKCRNREIKEPTMDIRFNARQQRFFSNHGQF